jgi:hypothetical protein
MALKNTMNTGFSAMGSFRQSHPVAVWTTLALTATALITAGVVSWVVLRPTPEPDVWGDELTQVADFVFDEDFNRLDPWSRLDYLKNLIKRFKDFDQDDAAMLSNFLTKMNERMREQIEENVKNLVADLMSDSARSYLDLPPHERAAYLDEWILYFDKMGDDINDRERSITDAERLAKIERRSQRDYERARERSGSVRSEGVNQFFKMYDEASNEVGAVERGEIAVFMRDLTRHLRGGSGG